MKLLRRQFLNLALVAAVISVLSIALSEYGVAQNWPTRPVSMVVPFAAGGATDVVGRILASRLSELLGQQVLVENVGGAGGMTGASRVAKAPPDGYQFLLGNLGTQAISQTLYKRPLYNTMTDFMPVGMFAQSYYVLITRKDLPVTTLPEFVAYAKANQAKMQYASAGAGSTTHMACVLLNAAMGTNITHVPYRSTAIGIQDMMAGRIDFICDSVETAAQKILGDTVKAVALLASGRTPVMPNLATAVEQGVPEAAVTGWYAVFLPKGTPEAIVRRLSNAVSATMDTPAVIERFESLGVSAVPPERRTPEYLAKWVPAEIEKWAGPIRASGVSMD
jgi:tripartite-type tricarboxylate transporter receptor subunit TctC